MVHRAFWSADGEEIPFYINNAKNDWSSAFKWWAEKGTHQVEKIKVQTTTLTRLFEESSLPYYIK